MFTRIGTAAAPRDAVDLLLECHERIRTFLGMAGRLANPGDASAPPSAGAPAKCGAPAPSRCAAGAAEAEVREAAARVARYFTQALPLHALDEEESLWPRLRGRDPALDAALESMAREHHEHEAPLRLLVRACERIAEDPALHREVAPVIAAAAEELERHFAVHLRREEEIIFPAVRRLLDARADAEIVRELRARRGVVEPPR